MVQSPFHVARYTFLPTNENFHLIRPQEMPIALEARGGRAVMLELVG